ncbi:lipopolysaccharide biosynthesis protein [Mucilaginibacter calamicampi]|uniref:Lipopolysaccharide biosynthesis protein n=1 Tax=Mucilaginibacter calamicampi TaxID=1302352 RepID=A0ABW2YSN7_9SPHI
MFKKVFNLIRNKHFLSLAGNIIMSGLGLVTTTLIYRALPQDSMGNWVLFLSNLLFIDTIRSGFLTTAFIKFFAGSSEERSAEVAGSAWFIGAVISGILALIGLCSYPFLHLIKGDGYRLFFQFSGLYYLISLPWFMATCMVQGQQKFDRLLYIRFCNQGSYIVFIIALMVTGRATIHAILASYLVSSSLTTVFVLIKGWSGISNLKHRTKAGILEIYHFGKFSVGSSLSSNMFSFSDVQIINTLLGASALAIYNLGQTLMQLVEIPLRSFSATGMPELSAAYNQGNRELVIHTMKRYAGMLAVVLIPIVIIGCALADLPIYIIGGGKYVGTEAANVFRLFLSFAIIFPPDRFFALTLDVIHQPKINFYKVLVMLAVNIATDFLGIYLTGSVYGIAFATVFPILTGTIIGYWALNRYSKFTYWSIFKTGFYEVKLFLKSHSRKKAVNA